MIGGRQTRYRSLNEEGDMVDKSETFSGRRVRYTWGPKVDSAGETADGRPFADIEEFKKLLLDDPRLIARNLVGQMVIYATGDPGRIRRPSGRQARCWTRRPTADMEFGR